MRDCDAHDSIAMVWQIVPQRGAPVMDAGRIQAELLDELAKLVVGQPSKFL